MVPVVPPTPSKRRLYPSRHVCRFLHAERDLELDGEEDGGARQSRGFGGSLFAQLQSLRHQFWLAEFNSVANLTGSLELIEPPTVLACHLAHRRSAHAFDEPLDFRLHLWRLGKIPQQHRQGDADGVQLTGVAVPSGSRSASGIARRLACPRSQSDSRMALDCLRRCQQTRETGDRAGVIAQRNMLAEDEADAREPQFDGRRPEWPAVAQRIERPSLIRALHAAANGGNLFLQRDGIGGERRVDQLRFSVEPRRDPRPVRIVLGGAAP